MAVDLPDTGNTSLSKLDINIGVYRESVLISVVERVKDKAGS